MVNLLMNTDPVAQHARHGLLGADGRHGDAGGRGVRFWSRDTSKGRL